MKSARPAELVIETWNTDDTFDHTLNVRVGVAMTEAEMSRYMPALAFKDFNKLMAEFMASQQKVRETQIKEALNAIKIT